MRTGRDRSGRCYLGLRPTDLVRILDLPFPYRTRYSCTVKWTPRKWNPHRRKHCPAHMRSSSRSYYDYPSRCKATTLIRTTTLRNYGRITTGRTPLRQHCRIRYTPRSSPPSPVTIPPPLAVRWIASSYPYNKHDNSSLRKSFDKTLRPPYGPRESSYWYSRSRRRNSKR